jgi:lipopolysaccharide/colanic/teichoic acid biosynthesis glycosyltransferase
MTRGKRGFDLFWSTLGLVLLWPLFLVLGLLIALDDGGPVLYRQDRVGKGGRLFRMLKFRTMLVDADKGGELLTVGRDPRTTRVGYWMRELKLDELPQLWNVLVGEMSLVGPRPEVPRYVARYTAEQWRVLDLTPGITDRASIRYRDESALLARASDPEALYVTQILPDKIRLNLEYAAHATVWTDFWIVLSTVAHMALPWPRALDDVASPPPSPPPPRRQALPERPSTLSRSPP